MPESPQRRFGSWLNNGVEKWNSQREAIVSFTFLPRNTPICRGGFDEYFCPRGTISVTATGCSNKKPLKFEGMRLNRAWHDACLLTPIEIG
jgi:hypothetical protein